MGSFHTKQRCGGTHVCLRCVSLHVALRLSACVQVGGRQVVVWGAE